MGDVVCRQLPIDVAEAWRELARERQQGAQTMKRLNGWQRIGVILSVIWLIGGGFATRAIVDDDLRRDVDLQWRLVEGLSTPDQVALKAGDFEKVSTDGRVALKRSMDQEVNIWTIVWTLAPLIATWALVYILVWLTRWVRAGFTQSPQ
jgi:hypothetical protein